MYFYYLGNFIKMKLKKIVKYIKYKITTEKKINLKNF